jgi:Tol biopolymer transport system component
VGRHTPVLAFVASVVTRARLRLGRQRHPLRLAIAVALLFLLLSGAATARHLLVVGNGKIAFEDNGRLLVLNPNGHGLRTIAGCAASRPGCAIFEAAWSPDGRRLAFVRGRVGGANERSDMFLSVVAADGRGARRLAFCGLCGEQYGGHLGWSPDAKRIAFSRDAGPAGDSLWVVAAAGGSAHRLTDCRVGCADVQPAWSPHAHLLLFQHITNTPGTSGLYTVRPDGSSLTRITNGQDPEWSPDGRLIAFDSGPDSIAVANADGSHVHLLLAGALGSGPGAPSWSPDGRKIVGFNTPGRPGHYRAELWTMNADGSAKKRLYHSGCCVGIYAPPIWSPDGRLIAFSANSAGGTFVINADESGLRRLSPITSRDLSWQRRPLR